jgi:hypothetical protein
MPKKMMPEMVGSVKMKPELRIDSDDLPEIKDYNPGEKVQMKMEGMVKSKSMGEKGKCSMCIEIDKMEIMSEVKEKAEGMGMDKAMYERIQAKRGKK